jgi:hypothetical protein
MDKKLLNKKFHAETQCREREVGCAGCLPIDVSCPIDFEDAELPSAREMKQHPCPRLFVVIMVSFFTADLLRDLSASPAFLNHVAGSGREDEIFLLCARLFFVAVVPYFT